MIRSKINSGITLKITQLAWMITLGSLCLFIAVNTSSQKRDLLNGLSSKGQSMAVSLSSEVASAAVSEDYTSVVQHSMDVVNGDSEIAFILIAKNDGYSLLVGRDGWKSIPKIDASWYQAERNVAGEIATVPLAGRRLYHYRYPLDCLGIPWGWIHIGVSLKGYDASVRQIYVRSAVLGLVCLLLSLIASILFARRLVRPLHELRRTAQAIAKGELYARVSLTSNDEIKQLGDTFNEMADAIQYRDTIVESVQFAARQLQSVDNWEPVGCCIIERLAQSASASRIMLAKVDSDAEGRIDPKIILEWAAEGVTPYEKNQSLRILNLAQVSRVCEQLKSGEMLIQTRIEPCESPFDGPLPCPIARLAAPIFADGDFWGALVLHDCLREREWKDVEQHALRTIADMFGAAIQRQRARKALLAAKQELEQRVNERTAELCEQILARDQAHAELKSAQSKLIELSRMSGMAEVATGVLHNVGNVLNSVNVSATLIADWLNGMKLDRLREITGIMASEKENLGAFLKDDPRGLRVVPYLIKLSDMLLNEREAIAGEAGGLIRHVAHVKEIVAMQQGYARSRGVLEKIGADELFENALSISSPALERHGVEILRVFEPIDPVVTDRHKVLQILLNLMQNAKDAVKAGGKQPRRIWVRLRKTNRQTVCFEVEDNGVGIDPSHLVRIFSHGFTTKKNGHGFGLHSGALAARDLGGSLTANSGGLGAGATFTLEIPLQSNSQPESGVTHESIA